MYCNAYTDEMKHTAIEPMRTITWKSGYEVRFQLR